MSEKQGASKSVSEYLAEQSEQLRRILLICLAVIIASFIVAFIGAAYIDRADSVRRGDFEIVTAEDRTATLIKYKGDLRHVEIPAKIRGYDVVAIGDEAFRGNTTVLRITVPDSVTSIGGFAFAECPKLRTVELPDSVSRISDGAFYRCPKLAKLTIPEGVTALEPMTFYDCRSLTVTAPHEPEYYTDRPDELTMDIIEWRTEA